MLRACALRLTVAVLGAALAASPATGADCGGARPCECGDRITSDYALRADLGPCPRDGLRLGARVILDGGGHAIRGSGGERSVGLVIPEAGSGSFVQNLTVSGFTRGVRLAGASRVELSRVTARNNGDPGTREGYGIDLAGGASSNRIEGARVLENADEGVHFGSHARGNRLVLSEVADNGRENVYFLHAVDNVVERCTLRGGGNAAAYIKHSKGTILVNNQIADRPVIVRGASNGTRLTENRLSGAALVLQAYDDEALGRVRPARTLVRGGAIAAAGSCVRAVGADGTLLDGVHLECPLALELGEGSRVGVVGGLEGAVRCLSAGEVRELVRAEARFVGANGSPLADVRVGRGDLAAGSADSKGVFMGEVVAKVRVCPELAPRRIEEIEITWSGGSTTRAPHDLFGTIVLESEPGEGAP